jgi:hypothetical protein
MSIRSSRYDMSRETVIDGITDTGGGIRAPLGVIAAEAELASLR